MIFTDEPWANEPGVEDQYDFKSRSLAFNQRCQGLTVRYAMIDWLKEKGLRNGIWKDVVAKYFELNGDKVLGTVRRWASINRRICVFEGITSASSDNRPLFGFHKTQNLLAVLEKELARRG